MVSRIFVKLCELPWARKILWKSLYDYLAGSFRLPDWTIMNYGYQPLDPGAEPLPLLAADETERYCIQLYNLVAAQAGEIAGKHVLEVGSGRGGGASFVSRYLEPARMVGADFSRTAVALANRTLGSETLSFVVGDAAKLPFPGESFDVVLNVESSHCYPSRPRFFSEVERLLRPGGVLSLADIFLEREPAETRAQLQASGLIVERELDITEGVLEGLRRDGARREAQIAKHAPGRLAPAIRSFAGTEGSDVRTSLETRRLMYVLFRAVKPGRISTRS